MKTRIAFSAIFLGLFFGLRSWVDNFVTLFQAQIAPQQVQSDAVSYGVARWFATVDFNFALAIGLLVALLLIWRKPIMNVLKKRRVPPVAAVVLFVGMLFLTGCLGPAKVEPIEEIGPNETAFVIPLEGDNLSAQEQFESIDYLESRKVAAKRIVIPVRPRSIGRWWWEFEYIPTNKVIRVDRSVVSREWVTDPERGTGATNEGIGVESSESVDFTVGVVCSAWIEESNAATYLYNFKKPLAEVMDENVRRYLQQELFAEFGARSLKLGQEQKAQIFNDVEARVKEHFSTKGITVDNCGGTDGLTYVDQNIQAAITANFEAQQAIIRAQAELDAQDLINRRVISETIALATAQTTRGDAEAYVLRVTGAELEANPLLVQYVVANAYNGEVPTTFVGSNFPLGMLMNMGNEVEIKPAESITDTVAQ